jgi:putative tryptophan/tyrosine transport system substrate-binding protein
MRRRSFLTLLGGAAAAWPFVARAQQPPRIPTIGFLDTASTDTNKAGVAEFGRGLADAGYVDGKNINIQFRWAGQPGRLQAMASELVNMRVGVIVANGALASARAAKAATSTIPIVLTGGADPVKSGLVASMNRPGGNITGMTSIHNELAGKRLSLLREMVPQANTIGYLTGDQRNEEVRALAETDLMLAAGRALGRNILLVECFGESAIEKAFAKLAEHRADGLVVSAFPLAFNNRGKIVGLAARNSIPAIYPQLPYAYVGGLMTYSAVGVFYQAGFYYVPLILKGAQPADLPVQQPTRFRLVINLKSAKGLGIEVPSTLLAIADEVIE